MSVALAPSFGALFGSFLNVVIWRLPLTSSVVGTSDDSADLGRLTVAAGLAVEHVA